MLSHTVPHCVNMQISTLPSYCVKPPTNLICPLKLHCPPEIIVQVACMQVWALNAVFIHTQFLKSIVLTCNVHCCLKAQTHKQETAQKIRLHFTDSKIHCMYTKRRREVCLRKLAKRRRSCSRWHTDHYTSSLIKFQSVLIPAGLWASLNLHSYTNQSRELSGNFQIDYWTVCMSACINFWTAKTVHKFFPRIASSWRLGGGGRGHMEMSWWHLLWHSLVPGYQATP